MAASYSSHGGQVPLAGRTRRSRLRDGASAGIEGSDRGSLIVIVLLYPFPASIPPPRKDRSETPLHLAATSGNTSLVPLLDSPPNDVLAIDVDGCTPLHPAAASCEHDVATSLVFRANERVSVDGDKYSSSLQLYLSPSTLTRSLARKAKDFETSCSQEAAAGCSGVQPSTSIASTSSGGGSRRDTSEVLPLVAAR